MFNTIVGAGAASRYGSGSDQMMRLLAAPAAPPQLCSKPSFSTTTFIQIDDDDDDNDKFFFICRTTTHIQMDEGLAKPKEGPSSVSLTLVRQKEL
jgi:hypothetical protein